MAFLNSRLETTVDTILQNSGDSLPAILLQGDHGPRMLTDFESEANTCMQQTFSAFAAYYLPGNTAAETPSDLSSVNLFRFIFNQYFSAGLPLLPNINYFPDGSSYVYRFNDVTDRAQVSCSVLADR